MTQSIKKFAIVLTVMSVVIFAFSITSNVGFVNQAQADFSCGSCETPDEPVTPTPPDLGFEDDDDDNSKPLPVCVLKVAPKSITLGGTAKLTWTSQNTAGNGTINRGVGEVNPRNVDGFRDVSPTATTVYTLTVTNSDGVSRNCSTTVTVVPPAKIAKCDAFSAAPTSVRAGGKTILTWATTNATKVVINRAIGEVAADGTLQVTVPTATGTYTYILTAFGEGTQKETCNATVTVTATPVVLVPVCDSFTTSATQVKPGAKVTLTWATTNATRVVIDKNVGDVPADGSKEITLPTTIGTYTYTLTAWGANYAADTCAVTIKVKDTPAPTVPVCDTFRTSATEVKPGKSVGLTWETTNATRVVIDRNVGDVSLDGNKEVFLPTTVGTYTYTLTAYGANYAADTCAVVIRVVPEDTHTDHFICGDDIKFTARDYSIDKGDSVVLDWDTTGATSVSINNGVNDDNNLDGSESVKPSSDTTYTLTASNGSKTVSCPLTIDVDTGSHGGGGSSSPTCKLTISDKSITLGERVTIKWDTSRATEVTLKDNHGKTLITTDDRTSSDKKDLYDGEITLRPDADTTYTLIAERGSKDRDCKVEVDVEDSVVITQIRDQQPLVTGISLTQVPYTGFEAGAFLTFVFYGLLALWALYLAYVLVVRKNVEGMVAAGVVTSDVIAPSLFTPKTTTTPDFHQMIAPVTSTAVVGYAAAVATEVSDIEKRAHAANVLLSADALAQLAAMTDATTVDTVTADVFAKAKASFPTEDGWVVLSQDRLTALTA